MKLDLATATLVLAAISSVAATPVAGPVVNRELTVREIDHLNNAIANLNHYNLKRDTMEFSELAKRENQIVTDVLTAITQTNLAPGIINYFIDDPTLSKITKKVIIATIESGVISLKTLLTSLNDSGLAVDVIKNLINNCDFYKQIYKLVLQQLANLPSLIGNILSTGASEIADALTKREDYLPVVPKREVQIYTRDTQDIITSLMESLKSSGLANQVVNALVVNDNFYTFGVDLIKEMIEKDLIDIPNIIDALIKSGLVPSVIDSFLNIDTLKTVIINALAAAFGTCSGVTPTTTLPGTPTDVVTLPPSTPTPGAPKVCKRRRKRSNY